MKAAILIIMLLSLFALGACTGAGPGARAPSKDSGGAVWQQKWDSTLAEAKKEGTVIVYVVSFLGADARAALAKGFKDKYGIDSQWTPLIGPEMTQRVRSEQRAGLNLADVFVTGATTLLVSMKPNDLLGPIEPMLILPEVSDAKAWDGGELFNFDTKDRSMITILRVINRSIVYNKDMVKADEITSYKDLLKPQYKGKLTITDPTQSGPGGWFAARLAHIYGFDEGMRILKELLVIQEAAIQRDARIHIETVARGKYAVALGGGTQFIADFLALGAPIAIQVPKEGEGGGPSLGALAVPPKPAHPNAAAVFVNWLLTKEGQSIFAKGTGNPSRRLDVSTEGIHPVFLPLPGEKIAWDTAEFTLGQAKSMEAAKSIVSQTGR